MFRANIQNVKHKLSQSTRPCNPSINVADYQIVAEGNAEILFPEKKAVFYNPIQQFNRDLSVTCIKAWDNLHSNSKQIERSSLNTTSKPSSNELDNEPTSKKRKLSFSGSGDEQVKESKHYIKVLEALSATGLRAIRYAREIPNIKEIVANDLLAAAVESIQRNVDHNNVSELVKPNQDDANVLMYRSKSMGQKFHVIDLDPYGTAAPFIDASMQAIEEDGLMLVTCTDLSVLAGNGYPEKCFALYGGVNMAGHEATHESALRLVLHLLGQSAAKYKKCIEPLLSLSIDFYVRVFIRVKTSPTQVKNLQYNTMVGYVCSGCGSYHTQRMGKKSQRESKKGKSFVKYSLAKGPPVDRYCSFCNSVHHVVGPMYGGPLHNRKFIEEVLRINEHEHNDEIYHTRKRIEGMLTLALNEIEAPFYFSPTFLSSILKFQVPPLKTVVAGLGSLGFKSSLTHAKPSSIKTDAPWDAIWYIMKKYCLDKKLCDPKNMNNNVVGYKILNNESIVGTEEWQQKLSFEPNEQSGEFERLRKLKIVRYQENPTKFWGPKARPQ
ncbi:HBR029Cp [Eremothecium sinecaudum]|uniref:tRNA (guanine(26)-N(2))-dimethyltransferase n=1 Tax=Eremothecium sinecaudum TaxID=45286 RepID=A0A120K126_9SACH|nr:HBR029Cp [Eremothecium sinecaudum]AMD18930.1 HBR029Cp [Eremothecium sinecaudum]